MPNTVIQVLIYEEERKFAQLEILSVDATQFNQLNNAHAQQENMGLDALKKIIRQIYPKTQQLYRRTVPLMFYRHSFY